MALRYVTAAGFRSRLEAGGGTSPSQDQAIPAHFTDDQLSVFLTDAESELETRVRSRYEVPLPNDPAAPIVVQLVTAVAAYHAVLAMRKHADITDMDPYYLRYQWALGLMTKIAKGEADIPGASDGFGAEVFDAYPDRLFSASDFGVGGVGPDRRTDYRRWRR